MGRLRLFCAAACIFVNEAKERKKMADCKKVAVIMGSDSDFPTVSGAVKTLKSYGVPVEVHVMSAHRTPEEAARFSSQAKAEGFGVIIAAAGKAAHPGGRHRPLH